MIKSENFFGKRDGALSDLKAFDQASERPGSTPLPGDTSAPSAARVVPASIANAVAASPFEGGSRLTVGPNIKLKEVEITDCDTLVVEGRVEAAIHARMIMVTDTGAFVGNSELEVAEIWGEFEGELTVRQKLVVYGSGRVTGKIRYGKLVIEEGGQVSGDIQVTGLKIWRW